MHTMPRKKSRLSLACCKRINLVFTRIISIMVKTVSTTRTGIILNLTALHAPMISHHIAMSPHPAIYHPHAQISIHIVHLMCKHHPLVPHHHKTLPQPHHLHPIILASYATIATALVMWLKIALVFVNANSLKFITLTETTIF